MVERSVESDDEGPASKKIKEGSLLIQLKARFDKFRSIRYDFHAKMMKKFMKRLLNRCKGREWK